MLTPRRRSVSNGYPYASRVYRKSTWFYFSVSYVQKQDLRATLSMIGR